MTSSVGQWVDTRPQKFQITDPIADPGPSDVSAVPPFSSGSGTKADPYILEPGFCATPGLGIISDQEIKITGQNPGWRVYFKDQSNLPEADRFRQQIGTINTSGNYATYLRYRDRPTSTVDGTIYTGIFEVGTCWLSWEVTQQVTDPISINTPTSIENLDGTIYRVRDTIKMTPGTITGGTPGVDGYQYFYYWERSDNGQTGSFSKITNPSSDVSAQQYTITDNDYGKFIRGVTQGVDNTTPVNQELIMPSEKTNGIAAAPLIQTIAFTEDFNNTVGRFIDQEFTTTYTLTTLGSDNAIMGLKILCSLPDDTILYPVYSVDGTVTSLGLPDPGFITMTDQTSPTITFPATFADSGLTPDDILPPGTVIKAQIEVSNSYGSDSKLSEGLIPVNPAEVTIPTPDLINGFVQYEDSFLADQTPFNTVVALGSYKGTYSFNWNASSTTITFDPAWDATSTPIAQFQGGCAAAGDNNFKIDFVDNNDATTSVTVNTSNTDWSLPIVFSDYSFTPPSTIKSIILTSLDSENPGHGMIQFFDASNNSVIYEKYVGTQNYLTRLKLEALDLAATRATRIAAAIHNLANPLDLKLEAFILPKAGFDSGNIYILHRNRAPGNINISFEILLTNLSTFTLTATNLSNTGTYDAFLTSLIAGLSTDSRVSVTADDGAIKVTPAATYAIDDIKVSITSGSLSSDITEDVNGTAVGAPTLSNTFNISVMNKTGANHTYGSGSLKAYYVAGVEANSLTFTKGLTYRFNQSHDSNTGYPLRLYTDEAKTTEYTTGVTTNGTPGQVGAYTQIATATNAPATLYYQSSSHSYMGGKISLS